MDKNKNKNKLSGLHTFQSDMAKFVRNKNSSVIDIAMAEKKEREVNSNLTSRETRNNKKNIFFIISSFLIIILTIVGVNFLIQKGKKNAIAKKEIIKIETFVSYENQSQLDLTNSVGKKELSKKLVEEVNKILSPGKIKFILLNTENNLSKQITTNEFISSARITMPENLLSSLTDNFMVGAFSPTSNSDLKIDDRKNSLFMIFETQNYEQTLLGMLDWEKTMANDLFLFFNLNISGENQKLLSTPFKDKVILNKDSRVLQNQKGNDVLYYLFIDKNTFIISDNQNTIKEILSRIRVKNIKPL